jgi:hypothetical protein
MEQSTMSSHANEVMRRAKEAQDEGQGVVARAPRTTFVAPYKAQEITPLPAHEITMAVDHPARQQVVVSTNAVDRAKGYQIVITPLAAALALLAVLVSLAFKNEFLTFTSLLIFWVTFCVVWLAGWIVTAAATPEFVSWYGAKRQWDVIAREQSERWSHYKWQTGRTEPVAASQGAPSQLQRDIRLALLIGVAVGVPLAIALIILGGML